MSTGATTDYASNFVYENNYYPFGLKHKGYNNVQVGRDHKFGFGNKEEQEELGLAWIDITARNYDAALGRWMNLDPLAEQMRRHSPYNYAFNNPIFFIDPDGMAPQNTDPVKKGISKSSTGTSPTKKVAYGENCLICGRSTVLTPTSGNNTKKTTVEFSKMGDDFSGFTYALIAVGASSSTLSEVDYSVTKATTNVSGTYLDADGNKLSSSEGAKSYEVKTTVELITANITINGDLPKEASLSSLSSTTTYSLTKSPPGRNTNVELTNGVTITSEPSMSKINFDNAKGDFKAQVNSVTKKNFETVGKAILSPLENIPKRNSEDFNRSLKKQ